MKISPMDTWNTTTISSNISLDRALAVMELLCKPKGLEVLGIILESGKSTFLDLTVHSGLDSESLGGTLDQLCSTRLVLQNSTVTEGEWYEPNMPYLRRVSSITKQLAAFHRQD